MDIPVDISSYTPCQVKLNKQPLRYWTVGTSQVASLHPLLQRGLTTRSPGNDWWVWRCLWCKGGVTWRGALLFFRDSVETCSALKMMSQMTISEVTNGRPWTNWWLEAGLFFLGGFFRCYVRGGHIYNIQCTVGSHDQIFESLPRVVTISLVVDPVTPHLKHLTAKPSIPWQRSWACWRHGFGVQTTVN